MNVNALYRGGGWAKRECWPVDTTTFLKAEAEADPEPSSAQTLFAT